MRTPYFLSLIGLFILQNIVAATDPLASALEAEALRNLEVLSKEERPAYFIAYRVTDVEQINFQAAFGSLQGLNQPEKVVTYTQKCAWEMRIWTTPASSREGKSNWKVPTLDCPLNGMRLPCRSCCGSKRMPYTNRPENAMSRFLPVSPPEHARRMRPIALVRKNPFSISKNIRESIRCNWMRNVGRKCSWRSPNA